MNGGKGFIPTSLSDPLLKLKCGTLVQHCSNSCMSKSQLCYPVPLYTSQNTATYE